MRRRFVHLLKQAGLPLNRSEASLLVHVFYEPGINQAGVANLLEMETISIVRLVDGLEQAGLVERRPHVSDRRFRTLWLTPAGEDAVARIRKVAETVRAEALEGIPPAECERLIDMLATIRSNLLATAETADSAVA
jgi:DNA-binding MarR family transcriptional regulator